MADSASGIMLPIKDGKVVDGTASGNTQSTTKKTSNSSLDKEAFLQLLVAQMKYQDPLEPTSNTEYISQLATFSSLEEMQNLNKTMTDAQGASLVGKQVILKTTSPVTGVTREVTGMVDFTMREGGKTYLSVDGNLYNIEDLQCVVDETYLTATEMAEAFKAAVAKLPSKSSLTLDNKADVEAVRAAVNAMTPYQQGFLDSDSLTKLTELVARIEELEKQLEAEKPNGSNGETEGTEGSEGTEGVEETE